MLRKGRRDLITDVHGLKVGNAADAAARSGTTVVLPDRPAAAGVDVRGGGPGTRETDLLDPAVRVPHVDAICLSGGSAFGLDAAGGAMIELAGMGRGYAVGPALVPLVPGAIIFDLLNGGNKAWGDTPPYRELGRAAVRAAAVDFELGTAGAGTGAMAGDLQGGLGSASARFTEGPLKDVTVGALVVVNPVGGTVVPGQDALWAAPLEWDGDMGGQPPVHPMPTPDVALPKITRLMGNTTLAVVATDLALDKAMCKRLAIMGHDGLARAIRPLHTPFDGDTVFALATGYNALPDPQDIGLDVYGLAQAGMAAADCLTRAVGKAMVAAQSTFADSYRKVHGHALTATQDDDGMDDGG